MDKIILYSTQNGFYKNVGIEKLTSVKFIDTLEPALDFTPQGIQVEWRRKTMVNASTLSPGNQKYHIWLRIGITYYNTTVYILITYCRIRRYWRIKIIRSEKKILVPFIWNTIITRSTKIRISSRTVIEKKNAK